MESSVAPAKSKPSRAGGVLNGILEFVRHFYSSEYNRIKRTSLRGVPLLLFVIAVGMTIFGLIMVLSASSVEMIAVGNSPFVQAKRQLLFAVLGITAMIAMIFVPVRLYRNQFVLHGAMAAVTLAQVAVLFLGVEVGGNRNWLMLGGIQVQPSEVAKLVTILWTAYILKDQGDISVGFRRAFFPLIFGVGPLLVLTLAGGDVGTLLVYAAFLFVMLWVGGLNRRISLMLGAIGVLAAAGAMMSSANRRARVLALLGQCDGSICDQANSGLAALASGGFWGVGLGRSRQKYNYLPEAHNDYIFAVIGEELGLLGALLIILFYLGIIYCAVRIIARSSDRFIQLASAGILTWFIFQALINIGMVTGLAPVIGVPLPFISYGGSSLISCLIAVGVLIGFARQTPLKRIVGAEDDALVVRPQSKDSERRAKLGRIVHRENQEFRKRDWQPSFDIANGQKFLRYFGMGPGEDTSRAKTRQERFTPSQRAAEPSRRPRVVPDSQPWVSSAVEGRTTSVAPSSSEQKPAAQRTEAAERKPAAAQAAPSRPERNDPQQEAEQQVSQPSTKPAQPKRKLPPGLAPVKQIRQRQQNRKNPYNG